MTDIGWDTYDPYAVHPFSLSKALTIPRIHLAPRVTGESGNYFNFVPELLEAAGKIQPFNRVFRVEQLGNK